MTRKIENLAIKIREYEAADYDNLHNLIAEFQLYLAKTDTRKFCKPFDSSKEIKQYTDQTIKDAKEREGMIYLAESQTAEREIIGFVQGIIDRHEKDLLYQLSHKLGDHGWVGELFVKPEFRSKGVARSLIKKMENYFRKTGCVNIRLCVMADNKIARLAYKRMGFEERDLELAKDL